jgi:hydrogenase expression/formation protein HypE
MVFVVPPEGASAALAALRAHPLGRNAAAIGGVEKEPAGIVLAEGPAGGARMVDMLTGDPLPRIC